MIMDLESQNFINYRLIVFNIITLIIINLIFIQIDPLNNEQFSSNLFFLSHVYQLTVNT